MESPTKAVSEHKRSNSEIMNSTAGTVNGQKANLNFLSSTKREDFWINQITTPFTHPTHLENPGPGKYNHEKRKDDIKARILTEETVHIPFGASAERDCNRKAKKHQSPGPGAYIDPNNPVFSSVSQPLLKFSSDRTFAEAHGIKLGPFGSNQDRFQKH